MPKPSTKFYVDVPAVAETVEKLDSGEEARKRRPKAKYQEISVQGPPTLDGESPALNQCIVIRYPPYSPKNRGELGHLFCTNFKVSFVPGGGEQDEEVALGSVRNKLIGRNDIALANIAAIYQDSGDKKKRLSRGKKLSKIKSEPIHIHTRDMAIRTFQLQTEKKDTKSEYKNLIAAILTHAFPNRADLLFAFEFAKQTQNQSPRVSLDDTQSMKSTDSMRDSLSWIPKSYLQKADWEIELKRVNASDTMKITEINNTYSYCASMPRYFPVPSGVEDRLLCKAAPQYNYGRLPMWCYSHTNKCFLLSVSTPILEIDDIAAHRKLSIQLIPNGHAYYELALNGDEFPKILDIQTAGQKLTSICVPETSIDLTCVLSSLIQLMLDPSSRTIKGFQNLVQKCWITAGHAFGERSGLLNYDQSDKVEAPVFLLFLDCVHQLVKQFPASFEFTDIYLISLWDSSHLGIFGELIFDNERERTKPPNEFAESYKRDSNYSLGNGSLHPSPPESVMCSVWHWDIQFSRGFEALFHNPLYQHLGKLDSPKNPDNVIFPHTHISQLDIWISCFYKHTTPMQVRGGGAPAEYLQQCILAEEITALQNQISREEEILSGKSRSLSRKSVLYFNSANQEVEKESLMRRLSTTYITSTFPFNNRMSRNVSDISLCMLLEGSSLKLSLLPDGTDYEAD